MLCVGFPLSSPLRLLQSPGLRPGRITAGQQEGTSPRAFSTSGILSGTDVKNTARALEEAEGKEPRRWAEGTLFW